MVSRMGMAGALVLGLFGMVVPCLQAGDEEPEKMAKKKIESWDKDGDHRLSKDEWKGDAKFGDIDKNDDGYVTLDELFKFFKGDKEKNHEEEAFHKKAYELLKNADKDGDHKLSWDELKNIDKSAKEKIFHLADENGDGVLDKEELIKLFLQDEGALRKKLEEKEKADREEKRKKDDQAAGSKDKKEPAKLNKERAEKKAKAEMEDSDADHDGNLSPTEWLFGDKPFEDADKNGDGYLNREEVAAYFLSRMGGIDTGKKED